MIVDSLDITEIITNIIIIVGAVGGAYLGIKKWVKRVANTTEATKSTAEATKRELATGNGSSIGTLVLETYDLATEANSKADRNFDFITMVSERLDAHVERGSHGKNS